MARKKTGKHRGIPWGIILIVGLAVFAGSFYDTYRKELVRSPLPGGKTSSAPSTAPTKTEGPPPGTGRGSSPPLTQRTPPVSVPLPTPVESNVAVVRTRIPPLAPRQTKVAIIIDDFGNNAALGEEFLKLPLRITVAILPRLPYSRLLAEKAAAAGKEILLHLPMEPASGKNPGPGEIRTSMKPDEIRTILKDNLATVPGARGINNHEGSKATADSPVMRAVIGYAKEHSLYFVDSVTSGATVGCAMARRRGVRCTGRDVFLDNEKDAAYIKGQLARLIERAKKQGSAVGIGHVHPETLEALKECAGELAREGVTLVTVNELLR